MERTRRLIWRTSCRRRLIFLRTRSILHCMSTKAAAIAAAGVVCVSAEEVCGRVGSMSVGCPAGGPVLGPGALANVVATQRSQMLVVPPAW
ncbi:hypothetical protein NDU88_003892 [Pleurodeles waltl]|uniref:Secreted protein n=1 Tax=Pleurodeles waltl TaxID=8319 RepID=A0AAV7NS92_PLEWA|nr:hypothetical protein NDU88_003892 [Pleurodeles waltl]